MKTRLGVVVIAAITILTSVSGIAQAKVSAFRTPFAVVQAVNEDPTPEPLRVFLLIGDEFVDVTSVATYDEEHVFAYNSIVGTRGGTNNNLILDEEGYPIGYLTL